MPRPFERVYTATQWEAIYAARIDRGTPAPRVAEMAAAGELIPGQPFTINPRYIYEKCQKEVRRRKGQIGSRLAEQPHRDAVEILRRRMISVADSLSDHQARLAAEKPANVDPERARQITRLIREAAALPSLKADTPPAPGTKQNGRQTEGPLRTREGALLAAHRGLNQPEPAETGPEPRITPEQPAEPNEPASDTERVEGSGSLTGKSATRLSA